MSGPVDWQTLQWIVGIIFAVLAAAAATGGMLWRWHRWLSVELQRRDAERYNELRERDQAIADLSRSLADHKLYAAEHFATNDSLGKALDGIQKSIDRLADRLDRLLPTVADRPPPRARG